MQFNQAMTQVDAIGWRAQVSDYPWGNYKRLLDIAGAPFATLFAHFLEAFRKLWLSSTAGSLGSMLARIMEVNPGMEGVLFDLPEVINHAKVMLFTSF